MERWWFCMDIIASSRGKKNVLFPFLLVGSDSYVTDLWLWCKRWASLWCSVLHNFQADGSSVARDACLVHGVQCMTFLPSKIWKFYMFNCISNGTVAFCRFLWSKTVMKATKRQFSLAWLIVELFLAFQGCFLIRLFLECVHIVMVLVWDLEWTTNTIGPHVF